MSHYNFFAALAMICSLNLSAQTSAFNGGHQWQKLGECAFTNDIIATAEPCIYNVTVEEDLTEKGIYRITDLWKDYPESHKKSLEADGFTFSYGDGCYLILDIRDPEYVRIPLSPIGLADQDGDYSACSPSEIIGRYVGVDENYAKERAGKLKDGIVSFSQPGAIFLSQDEWFIRSNLHGATGIDLSEFIAGISDVLVEDNSPTEYFNILGVPVKDPGSGIYICRKGNKTSKILKR